MPVAELQDFQLYWRQSILDDIGNSKPAGGFQSIVNGVTGVDYQNSLMPWSKGNSPSYDKSMMRRSVFLLNKLVDRLRLMLRSQDLGKKGSVRSAGVTFFDIEINMGKAIKSGRYTGQVSDKWIEIEWILQSLLHTNHVQLFNTLDERSLEEEGRIKEYLKTKQRGDDEMGKGICQFLDNVKGKGGHVRLNREFGWETFIRDYLGAPYGVSGVIPGSLAEDIPKDLTPTMPIPLHLCLAETIAKTVARTEDVWGKSQLKVRKAIANAAKPNSSGVVDRISLDDYYRIFAVYGVLHMAETVLQSSKSNSASAKYDLQEVLGSSPKTWDVLIDPDLIRWRELQREREVSRGLNDDEGDSQ
jgi:hypothetical protein